ncbi:MAG: hypothetical protein U0871_01350 [Gemmataceae bacterium]
MARQPLTSYKDVQSLFDEFIASNQIPIDDSPHGSFWNDLTYDQFVSGDVPSQPGVKILVRGKSTDSNLIKILKGSLTVGTQQFRRMPGGGPVYMTDEMVAALADWIDRDCPNP